jgi:hypothetical protein
MGETRAVRTSPGTYRLREVVTPEVKEARPVEPGEVEPLTWEELLSLPAEQRAKWAGGPA